MNYDNIPSRKEPDDLIDNRTFENRICHQVLLFVINSIISNMITG
jgi:hypothetical protein